MATQYIKYAKKCLKNFFSQIIGGGGMAFFGQGVATPMSAELLILRFNLFLNQNQMIRFFKNQLTKSFESFDSNIWFCSILKIDYDDLDSQKIKY